MLRILPQTSRSATLPAAAGTAWSGSAESIVIADDRFRSGPTDESSGLLQLFLRLSPALRLRRNAASNVPADAPRGGRFGRRSELSPTQFAFATFARLRGL
jgi:hypothetical protein